MRRCAPQFHAAKTIGCNGIQRIFQRVMQIGGSQDRNLFKMQLLNDYHYEGYLGQEITDGRYFDDPKEADRKNIAAFEPYFK